MPHLRDIPLAYLEIVMVGTRFPENVGMAVRACANMGCGGVILAAPERWDVEKARPLATAKGMQRLEAVRVVDSLSAAVRDKVRVYGTTARTGGWRQSVLTPEQAAEELAPLLLEDCPTALVFGPEDRGLNNAEIESCQRLVTIPTSGDASSLNVAQAVLLLAYECRKAVLRVTSAPSGVPAGDPAEGSRRITQAERDLLYARLRETLLAIDFLRPDNPEYFLMPVRRFLGKSTIRRHEMDMLMGICRQVNRLVQKKGDGRVAEKKQVFAIYGTR